MEFRLDSASYHLLPSYGSRGREADGVWAAVGAAEADSILRRVLASHSAYRSQLIDFWMAYEHRPERGRFRDVEIIERLLHGLRGGIAARLRLLRRWELVGIQDLTPRDSLLPEGLEPPPALHFIEVELVDQDGEPHRGVAIELTDTEDRLRALSSRGHGIAYVGSLQPGSCKIVIPGDEDDEPLEPADLLSISLAFDDGSPAAGTPFVLSAGGSPVSGVLDGGGHTAVAAAAGSQATIAFPQLLTKTAELRSGVAVSAGGRTRLVALRDITKRNVSVVEMEDALFNTDSAVFLPDIDPQDLRVAPAERVTGLGVLAAVLQHAQENPDKALLIAGHADTKGSPQHNVELSVDRANNVLHALLGEGDAWVELCKKRHQVLDYQQILRWIAITWSWPCDPGELTGKHDQKTDRAVRRFQAAASREFGQALAIDGVVGTQTWTAFFQIYRRALARLMGVSESDLQGRGQQLKFVAQKAIGCGESHPREAPGQDEQESSRNRRVELLFFAPGDEPKLACHPGGGGCQKAACDLYVGEQYEHQYLPAPALDVTALEDALHLTDPTLGPLRSLAFRYDDRIQDAGDKGAFVCKGARGVSVGRLQSSLHYLGVQLKESMRDDVPDGDFGDETFDALKYFQESFPNLDGFTPGEETQRYLQCQPDPLTNDGEAGPKTLHAIDAMLLDARIEGGKQPGSGKAKAKSDAKAKSLAAAPAPAPLLAKSGGGKSLPVLANVIPAASVTSNRCGLKRDSPTFDADLEACFVKELNARRPGLNKNNLTRTEFYAKYYGRHQEVPWSMLASLVSRNAGYQMTDLERYLLYGTALPLVRAGMAAGLGLPLTVMFIERFLESGNYLIFHDVYPQLLAYEMAKEVFLSTGDDRVVKLFMQLPRLAGVEQLVAVEWVGFFEHAKKEKFWAGRPAPFTDPIVIRHSVGLVSNEQNYLEDRLMLPTPGSPLYMDHPLIPGGTHVTDLLRHVVFPAMAKLQLTRLAFIGAGGALASLATDVHIHFVGDFSDVAKRIDTGRKLMQGVFVSSRARADAMIRWQFANAHTGSRFDYDTDHYDKSKILSPLTFDIYSPDLDVSKFPLPGWPATPPAPSLPSWGARDPAKRARFLLIVGLPLPADCFVPPEGKVDPAGPSRACDEIFL